MMNLEEYLRYQYRGYGDVPRSFVLDEILSRSHLHQEIVMGMFFGRSYISIDELVYAVCFIIGEVDGD